MADTELTARYDRRHFLRGLGAAGSLALGNQLLAACSHRTPPHNDGQVIHLLWSDVTRAYTPLLEEFTRASGIKVVQTIVPYNQRLDKINTTVLGGGDFDVIQMDTVWTAQFAAAGWVEDLTDRLTDTMTSDIPASSLRAVTYRGKVYGVPLFNSAKHLFYHQGLLRQAGFDRPPATLDDFVFQAKTTTKPGQWGSIWSWKQSEALVCDWLSIMFTSVSAQLTDADGGAVFHRAGGVEALQWMVDLLFTHRAADPASLECTEDDVRKALQTGRYALTYNWEGVLPEANDPAKSRAAPHVRVALLPGAEGVRSASVSGAEGWAILSHSKRKEVAWQLLRHMAGPSWQKGSAMTTGNYPILASLYSDPELQRTVQDFSVYGEQFNYLVVRPQIINYAQISDIIQKHLHAALLREVSSQEAIGAAAAEVNRAMATP
jgi:multiple sugar transport system substrate-binding protein